MPRFSLDPQASPRERKVTQYHQMQSGNQQQQVIDQQGQGSMIDMLKTLYGLHAQSQIEPLQMQALQQDVQAKGFENMHAPELLQSKLGADAAQQAYYTARDTGAVTPRDELQYKMHTGQDWVSPEQQAALAKQKAAEQAAAREADQALQAKAMAGELPKQGLGAREGGLLASVQGMGSLSQINGLLPNPKDQELLRQIIARNQAAGVYDIPPALAHPVDSLYNFIFGKPVTR